MAVRICKVMHFCSALCKMKQINVIIARDFVVIESHQMRSSPSQGGAPSLGDLKNTCTDPEPPGFPWQLLPLCGYRAFRGRLARPAWLADSLKIEDSSYVGPKDEFSL